MTPNIGMIWKAGTVIENEMDAGIQMLQAEEDWCQSRFQISVTKYSLCFPELEKQNKTKLSINNTVKFPYYRKGQI